MKNYHKVIICLLPFLLFSWFLYYTIPYQDGHRELDSGEYESIANNFALTGRLNHAVAPFKMPSHTIGYHLFLGVIYRFFGLGAVGVVVLIQVMLGLLCCLIVYGMALQLFGPSVALVSLFLAACNLGILVYAQLLMADVLMLTLLLGFLYLFIGFVYDQDLKKLAFAAFILSLSVIVKPVAIYFIVPLMFFIWCALKDSARVKLFACIIAASIFYAPLVGYMAYNYSMYGIFAVTTLVRENLYVYFLPRRILPRLEPELQKNINKKIEATQSEAEFMKVSEEIFNDLVKTRPLLFCFAWCESMFKVFFGIFSTQLKILYNGSIKGGCCSFFAMPGNNAWERLHQYASFGSANKWLTLIAYADIIGLLVRYILVFIAFLLLLQARNYFWLLFFNCYIGYFTFVTGHDGGGRYRMMFEPLLIILAAYALVWLYYVMQKYLSQNKKERYGASGA